MADVCIYVEDPGAANYVVGLEQRLSAEGISSTLLADGDARAYLSARDVVFQDFERELDCGEMLDECRPRLLLTGTSENTRSAGLELIDEAARRGLPSLAVIDMLVNAEHRFRGESDDPLAHAPDWLVVPDEATADIYRELGFPSENVRVCGYPHFDRVRERAAALATEPRLVKRRRLLPELPENRPLWLFVAESHDRLNPEASLRADDFTLSGRGGSDFRTAIVLEELLDAAAVLPERPFIMVRLHPKNKMEEFSTYQDEVDAYSEGGDPLELVWVADMVVGMTSMLLTEAAFMERSTLAILPRESERMWLPNTAGGITPVASTREQLHRLLQERRVTQQAPDVERLFLSDASERLVGFIRMQLERG